MSFARPKILNRLVIPVQLDLRPAASRGHPLPGDDRQVPPEPGQPRRVRGQGVLHGGRQPFHPQEQGAHGRLPGPPFGTVHY